MLTAFGKELRKLRIDNSELMKDMAKNLNVTVSYLSAVENGKRNVPRSWVDTIAEIYSLSPEQYEALQEAFYESQQSIEISLKNKSKEDLDFLFAFARHYEDLGKDDKKKIFEILKK